MRQRRRHLGDAEAQSDVEEGDDDERGQHAAESAGDESEIPAEEIAGNYGADTQSPQIKHSGVPPQSAFLEVSSVRFGVGDVFHCTRLYHRSRKIGQCPTRASSYDF